MFRRIEEYLRTLVKLAQERNTYALASLNETRAIHEELRVIHKLILILIDNGEDRFKELQKQTALLTEIAAELKPPPPSPATQVVITLGKQIPQ